MKKIDVKILSEIAIVAAIAFVLDYIQGAYTDLLFPNLLGNGGSIGIAMLPIIILSLRRGIVPGLLCGVIVGCLDLMDGFWTYSDEWYKALIQVLMDYVIAYTAVGMAGLMFKKVKGDGAILFVVLACVIAGLSKYGVHVICGIFFWPADLWGGFISYAFLYNAIYMIPSIILCSAVLSIIYIKNKKLLILEEQE